MEEGQYRLLGTFTWEISNFSKLASRTYCSDVFTIAGCNWQIRIWPKLDNDDYVFIFLSTADDKSLHMKWSRNPKLSLSIVDQNCRDLSITAESDPDRDVLIVGLGCTSIVHQKVLYDQTRGYLLKDTLIVEASVCVFEVVPAVITLHSARETDRFVCYFDSLDELIAAAEKTSRSRECPSSVTQTPYTGPQIYLSSEEVEIAKESMNQHLSDLLEQDISERIASALTLGIAAETVPLFEARKPHFELFADFSKYLSYCLDFDRDNFEYNEQKAQSELLLSAMKENRKKHLSYKELSEKLASEEQELKKKLEETKRRNATLISDWEALIAESEETKSKYVSQGDKVAKAEERKRISKERVSTAWWPISKERLSTVWWPMYDSQP